MSRMPSRGRRGAAALRSVGPRILLGGVILLGSLPQADGRFRPYFRSWTPSVRPSLERLHRTFVETPRHRSFLNYSTYEAPRRPSGFERLRGAVRGLGRTGLRDFDRVLDEGLAGLSSTPKWAEEFQQSVRYQLLLSRYDIDIRRVKRKLKEAGFPARSSNGVWTSEFGEAVELFQRAHGVAVDGVPGPDTQQALKRVGRWRSARLGASERGRIEAALPRPIEFASGKYELQRTGRNLELRATKGESVRSFMGIQALRQLEEVGAARATEFSRGGLVFSYLAAHPETGRGAARLSIGGTTLSLSAKQLRALASGRSVPPKLDRLLRDLPRARIVLIRDRLAEVIRAITPKYAATRVSSTLLLRLLSRKYATMHDFYLDDDPSVAAATLTSPAISISGARDVGVYLPSKSFKVTDRGAVSVLREEIVQEGLKLSDGESILSTSNVVVISAHKTEQFQAYIRKLARDGAFRGKYVVFLSCYQRGDETFNSENVIQDGGAKTVLFFSQSLNAYAVRSVMKNLLKELAQVSEPAQFHELFERSVRVSIREASGDAVLVRELRRLLGWIRQVSDRGEAHDNRLV